MSYHLYHATSVCSCQEKAWDGVNLNTGTVPLQVLSFLTSLVARGARFLPFEYANGPQFYLNDIPMNTSRMALGLSILLCDIHPGICQIHLQFRTSVRSVGLFDVWILSFFWYLGR